MIAANILDPARADALAATLGMAERFSAGDALPPFFHQIYFLETWAGADLDRDGHTRLGPGLVPDRGLPSTRR